jgi:molybdate transport system ATP-binding protein
VNLTLSHLRTSVPGFVLQVNAVLEGQVVALFGPSGAGKTSLLDLIAGLRLPDGGRVELDGRILSDHENGRWVPTPARGVGYVFQDQALFPHLSVRRNVSYGAHKGGVGNGMFTLDHVADVLEIATLLDRRPETLSGGEKQRVALARALLSQPRVLLLDEPLSNLDESLREQSLGLLRRVRDEFGVPMVYVSHRAQEIVGLCDDVLMLERGRVVGHGAPEACFERTTTIDVRVRARRQRPAVGDASAEPPQNRRPDRQDGP